jgi:LysM repeat protein
VSSANGKQVEFAHDVTYGAVTPYATVPAGTYAVSMYPTGIKKGRPLLQGTFTVVQGGVYTVAVTGTPSHLVDRVINDQLSPPTPGHAKVRVVQASTSVGSPNIRVVGGATLASDVSYGTVTDYADVPSGKWELSLSTRPKATDAIDLTQGDVYSILVLNSSAGAVIRTTTDASTLVPSNVNTAAPSTTNAAPPSTTNTSAPSSYVVQNGDSFWSIAQSILESSGNASPTAAQVLAYMQQLIAANESQLIDPSDPNLIFVGQSFTVPALT